MKQAALSRLRRTLRPHPVAFAVGSTGLLAAALLALLPPLVVARTIDGLTAHRPDVFVWLAALQIVTLSALQGVCNYVARQRLIGVSRDVEYTLRRDFFAHLLTQPAEFFQSRRIGDLISLATNDISAVRMMTGPAIMQSVSALCQFCCNLAVMVHLSWRLTLLALCALPLIALCSKFFGQRIHERFEAVQKEFATLSSRIQETLSGVRVVRAYHQEEAEIRVFEAQNESYVRRNRAIIGLQAFFHPFLGTIAMLGAAAVLWRGGLEVMRGHLTLGAFVQFNMYLTRLSFPMLAAGWVVNLFQRGLASLQRLEEPLSVVASIQDGPAASPPRLGEIAFVGVGLRNPERGDILSELTLEVRPGETLGLVGPTGCGKTTLLNLVPRLIDAQQGTVMVDGMDVQQWSLADLRSRIAYVTQESFLFSRTLADNIALGSRLPTSNDALYAAAVASGLEADLPDLPQGMETLIGERGVTLSGGQKQRVSLARAKLRDPDILLLDDAFSSVDSHTEALILEGLAQARRGRTTVVVSHRLAALKAADRVAVMDGGRLVAVGPHESLLSTCSLYAELWEQQRLADELAQANV